MNRMIFLPVTLAIVCLLSIPLHVSSQEEMTLEEAIRIGLKNNHDILIARNNAAIAENNSGKGTASMMPSLNASASTSRSSNDVTTNSLSSLGDTEGEDWRAQIAIDWTIFDGFSMFAEKRRFAALGELGQAQARSVIENSVVLISRAYFSLVSREQLLDVLTKAQDISHLRLEKANLRRDLGGASSTDQLNAQVAFNADRAALLEGELAVVVARQALNLTLGREADHPANVSTEIILPSMNYDASELEEMAFEHNSELVVFKRQKQVARSSLTSSKARFLPRLSLNGTYSYSDETITPDTPPDFYTRRGGTSMGLYLTWNLFNGGRDRIDWQNAKVELNSQQLALERTKQRLRGQLAEQRETYTRRMVLKGIEETNVEAAQRNLDLMLERYEMGAVTSLEFRDAQVHLIRAQTSLIGARHQVRLATLEIQKLTGRLSIE